MNLADVAKTNADSLSPQLRRAQDAMHLPEVQEMLRKLSSYNLGIFMPHMHDADSGDFKVLPHDLVQVEAGLRVTFKPADQADPASFVPVGWVWHDDGIKAASKCVVKCISDPRYGHSSNHSAE